MSFYLSNGSLSIPVEGESLCIGRSEQCDLRLRNQNVSRRHCRIRVVNGKLLLEDLGSTNGTFVNGKRIAYSMLKIGDVVSVAGEPFLVDSRARSLWERLVAVTRALELHPRAIRRNATFSGSVV